jgi:hypothetical protein
VKNDYFPQFRDIVTLLQNSSVSEPIFLAVIRIISPLVQWINHTWEEMILHGFEELEEITDQDDEPGYSREELVKSSIF